MSWAIPSVMRIAPPTRSGGASASAERSAANSRVPWLSGSLAARLDEARLDIVERGETLRQGGARFFRLPRPFADLVGGGLIDHHRDDVLQRPAVLARQRRIEKREQHEREGEAARRPATPAPPGGERRQHERGDRQPRQQRNGRRRREGDRPRVQCDSLSKRSLAWTWSAL